MAVVLEGLVGWGDRELKVDLVGWGDRELNVPATNVSWPGRAFVALGGCRTGAGYAETD